MAATAGGIVAATVSSNEIKALVVIEVDTLEGDDTIYVRSTAENVITTVTGGLGNDTIEVLGDVTAEIFTNDLLGYYSVIGHDSSSDDSNYSDIGIPGLDVLIVDPNAGQLVDITESADHTRVLEGGRAARHLVDELERAVQKLGKIKKIESRNIPGQSTLTIEMRSTVPGDALPHPRRCPGPGNGPGRL